MPVDFIAEELDFQPEAGGIDFQPETTGTIGGIVNSYRRGNLAGQRSIEALQFLPEKPSMRQGFRAFRQAQDDPEYMLRLGMAGEDPKQLARVEELYGPSGRLKRAMDIPRQSNIATARNVAELTGQIDAIPQSEAMQEWNKANNANWWQIFARNPVEITANIFTESIPQAAPAMAATMAAGPVGAAAGSLGVEAASSFVDAAQTAGVDLHDPEQVRAFFTDEDKVKAARAFAAQRGLPIALLDAVTAGVAGKFLKPALGQGVKRVAGATAAELGMQMAGGAGGEALAQAGSGQPLNVRDIVAEAIGELATAPAEVTSNLRSELDFRPEKAVTEVVTKQPLSPPADTSPDALADLQAALRGESPESRRLKGALKPPVPEKAAPTTEIAAAPAPTEEMRAALEFQRQTDEAVRKQVENPDKDYSWMSSLELELLEGMGDAGAIAERRRRRAERSEPEEQGTRFQWMRNAQGGQVSGNQQVVRRLTEQDFKKYLKPRLDPGYAGTLAEYQQKQPDQTHISLYRREGKGQWQLDRIGTEQELTPKPEQPQWVRQVEDFASAEAITQSKTADTKEVIPSETQRQKEEVLEAKPVEFMPEPEPAKPTAPPKTVIRAKPAEQAATVATPVTTIPESGQTFKRGERVFVRKKANLSKTHPATVIRDEGSEVLIRYQRSKLYETLPKTQVQEAASKAGRRAYEEQFTGLEAGQRRESKAAAREFKKLVVEYGPVVDWYDVQHEMAESKQQRVQRDRALATGIERAMRAIGVPANEIQANDALLAAKWLPKLKEYVAKLSSGQFALNEPGEFGFDAPESVEEQKARQKREAKAKADAETLAEKKAFVARGGERLLGNTDEQTQDLFGGTEERETRRDSSGQGSLFARPAGWEQMDTESEGSPGYGLEDEDIAERLAARGLNETEAVRVVSGGRRWAMRLRPDGIVEINRDGARAEAFDHDLDHELAHLADRDPDVRAAAAAFVDALTPEERAAVDAWLGRGYGPEARSSETRAEALNQLRQREQAWSAWQRLFKAIAAWWRRVTGQTPSSDDVARVASALIARAQDDVRQRRLAGLPGSIPFNGGVLVPPGSNAAAQAITAHHGTPHTIGPEGFKTDRIGTGEGAQVYGWGLYFAENREVSRSYAERLGDKPKPVRMTLDGHEWEQVSGDLSSEDYHAWMEVEGRMRWWNPDKVDPVAKVREELKATIRNIETENAAGRYLTRDRTDDLQSLRVNKRALAFIDKWSGRLKLEKATKGGGNEYTVSINAEPDELLDWDKPLSQQSEKVKKALRTRGISGRRWDVDVISLGSESGRYVFYDALEARDFAQQQRRNGADVKVYKQDAGDPTGERLYRDWLSGYREDKAAAHELARAGIKGIKYLDQFSRQRIDVDHVRRELARAEEQLASWSASDPAGGGRLDIRSIRESQIAEAKKDIAHYKSILEQAAKGEAGTYNYVIFNDSDIRITGRNGEPVSIDEAQAEYALNPQSLRGELNNLESEMRQHEARGEPIPQELLDRYHELANELGEQIRSGRLPSGQGRVRVDENLEEQARGPRGEARGGERRIPQFRGPERLPHGRLRDLFTGLRAFRQRAGNWLARRGAVSEITVGRDAADNRAGQAANQASLRVRLVLNRAFDASPGQVRVKHDLREAALTFVVEADGDRSKLSDFYDLIAASEHADSKAGRQAMAALEYAEANWERFNAAATEYRALSETEREAELNEGVNSHEWRGGYVYHRWQREAETGADPTQSRPAGTPFRNTRSVATYAEGIAGGRAPVTLNALELLAERVAAGQRRMNELSWVHGLRNLTDPATGEPVVTDVIRKPRRPVNLPQGEAAQALEDAGETYRPEWVSVAPEGYSLWRLGDLEVAVKEGFGGLLTKLTSPSFFKGEKAKKVFGAIKSALLMFDTFHLGRMVAWRQMFGLFGGYQKGQTLLDFSAADIREMAQRGEIPESWVDGLMENKRRLALAINTGFNVGNVLDNAWGDALHNLPGIGTFNKWLFGQYQRGAMTEAWLIEFERMKKALPNVPERQVARRVSQNLNTRFGNLNRQGLFKSRTAQDLARFIFLAPQWNESLIRSELGALGQAIKMPVESVQQRRIVMGTLLRATGLMAVGTFLANQILNYAFRGKPTWENEEEGFDKKISAYIPDAIGGGPGMFLNPLALPAEYTHLIEGNLHRSRGDWSEAFLRIFNSRLHSIARAGSIFVSRRDVLGQKLRDGEVLPAMAKAMVPVPIAVPSVAAAGKELVTGEPSEKYPGQYQKQILSSFGVKTDQAPSAEQRIRNLAGEFNREKGIVPNAEFFSGDYDDLNKALRIGNDTDAQEAMEELLKKKTAKQVADHFARWVRAPYTGQIGREREFFNSLTPEQRRQYTKSRDDRRALAIKARAMVRQAVAR